MPSPIGYGKECHLRRRSEFLMVKDKGRTIPGRSFILGWLPRPESQPTRFGLVVTKRMGNAVCRNRIRRRVKEVLRLARPETSDGHWIVVIPRHSCIDRPLPELREEWRSLLIRAKLLRRPPPVVPAVP